MYFHAEEEQKDENNDELELEDIPEKWVKSGKENWMYEWEELKEEE